MTTSKLRWLGLGLSWVCACSASSASSEDVEGGGTSSSATGGAETHTPGGDTEGSTNTESESGGEESPPLGCSEPDPEIFARAQEALEAWQIGMPTDLSVGFRDFGLTPIAPRNWITVASADCSAIGVAPGTSCAGFGASVLGVCATTYREDDGAIFDTTVVVFDEVFDGSNSVELERSVLIHEIGHCLGLKHSPDPTAVMNAVSDASRVVPNAAELDAIAGAYLPGPAPIDPQTAAAFFSQTGGGDAVRHFVDPVFHISSCIGNEPEGLAREGAFLPGSFVGADGRTYRRVVHTMRQECDARGDG